MVKQDTLLTLGLLGIAGFAAFKLSKGVGIAGEGLGEGISDVAGDISGVTGDVRNVTEGIASPFDTIEAFFDRFTEKSRLEAEAMAEGISERARIIQEGRVERQQIAEDFATDAVRGGTGLARDVAGAFKRLPQNVSSLFGLFDDRSKTRPITRSSNPKTISTGQGFLEFIKAPKRAAVGTPENVLGLARQATGGQSSSFIDINQLIADARRQQTINQTQSRNTSTTRSSTTRTSSATSSSRFRTGSSSLQATKSALSRAVASRNASRVAASGGRASSF